MYFKCISKPNGNYENYVVATSDLEFDLPNFLSENIKNSIKKLVSLNEIKKDEFKKLELNLIENEKIINLIILYLGDKDKLDSHNIREYLYEGMKDLENETLFITFDEDILTPDILAEVTEHINYIFDKYLTKKKEKFLDLSYYTLKDYDVIEGEKLAEIAKIVKDLINEPSEVMNPKELANHAIALGEKFGIDVQILDENKALELGMNSYLAVARAAYQRPNVIVMRYHGDKESNYTYGLVGKGLTYDTGGLSLKPTSGMIEMKEDMAGAATVIGTMCALASMKIKKNVTCVIAACENSISGNSYRPGDIIKSMNGKTIEVTNTDAEGRLTLIDAITYSIRNEKVNEIIDVATLTGAVMVALGEEVTGVFSNNDEMAEKIISSSKNWNEYYWQLPMYDIFKKNLKSKVADIQNSGSRWGGAINAAKFIEEFVEDVNWVHLDVASTVFDHGTGNKYYKYGPTGEIFRTIYTYIKEN